MKQKSTRPVMTSVSAAGPPLNGTWVALMPAESKKRSAAQCVALPTPAEAKVSAPTLVRSTRAATVVMPVAGATNSTLGTTPKTATPAKSLAGSYVRFG